MKSQSEIQIDENTFAAACIEWNSIEDLEYALANDPDRGDMIAWSLTPAEWRSEIKLALAYLKAAKTAK